MAYQTTDKQTGRPSTYTKELADKICDRMANGDSLSSSCRRNGMPSKTTFLRWVKADKGGLQDQYVRAREQMLEDRADQIADVVNDNSHDEPGQAIQRDRLIFDHAKWELSKLLPKKYGDKTTLEHQGKDGGAINIVISEDDAAHLGLKSGDDEEGRK